MIELNGLAIWIGLFLGMLSGAVTGLFFDREGWLGGYGSWPRRLVRLGHISFFGLALVNLIFVLSAQAAENRLLHPEVPSLLFLTGAITMPAVCFLSAWKPWFKNFFFVPVGSLLAGALWMAAAMTPFFLTEVLP